MLAAHDAVTTKARKAQHMLGKLVNQSRHAAHTASLDQLPETARPPGPDDPLGQRETKTNGEGSLQEPSRAVSYTHLTLPTILLV